MQDRSEGVDKTTKEDDVKDDDKVKIREDDVCPED